MGIASEYNHLFVLRNEVTGMRIFYYWASSQKHKALFGSYAKAKAAAESLTKMGNKVKIEMI